MAVKMLTTSVERTKDGARIYHPPGHVVNASKEEEESLVSRGFAKQVKKGRDNEKDGEKDVG